LQKISTLNNFFTFLLLGGTKKEFRGAVIVKLFTLVNYGTTSFHGMSIHGTSLHGMHLIHICSWNLVVHGMTFMKNKKDGSIGNLS
jgi:hypothetical protein